MLFCHITSRTSVVAALVCAGLSVAAGLKACTTSAQTTPAQTKSAQSPAGISLVQLAELPRILDPQLSPDGRSVAYMLSAADWTANRATYHLWRQDIGRAPVALTSGGSSEVQFTIRWSPDGTSILFGRAGQLMLIPAAGGTPRAVTKHANNLTLGNPAVGPTWSPDGKSIYFTASDPPTPDERERDRRRDDVYAYEHNYKQRHLWRVDVATGTEKQITTGDLHVARYRLSPDGSRVVLERMPTPLVDDEHNGELWVMDADGGNARQLTRNRVEEKEAALSPDNSQVIFTAGTNVRFEQDYNDALFIVPASGGTPKLVAPEFPYAVDQIAWAPDGKSVFLVANMGIHSELFRLDLATKRATQMTDGKHGMPPWSMSVVPSAGKILLQLDEPSRYGDAWTLPLSAADTTTAPTRITGVFDGFEQKYAVPRQEKFSWKSNDGTAVEGVLIYPRDYTPGTKYPLVVQLHGGPEDSDKFGIGAGSLLYYFPVLSGKGWFVLRPNYRGSTGYGNAFLRDVVKGYFRNMPRDVLSGVNALVKQGLVDTDKVVVMGWSAGGHLTNKLITMTTRFKVASAGAGASDWLSFVSQSDRRDDRIAWFGGTPWQKNAPIMSFWNASPLKDAANVKTPTLFFIGENDPRVPLPQSQEMYQALKYHKVPTNLYIAPREGHQWGELRHQIFKANAEMAWFEKYALGRDYVPEIAPAP
jgi:dipeptidyl aminopeptidase/acylaminoacyl peptidase